MTVGLFAEVFNQYAPLQEKYSKIGRNTGNILFLNSLKSVLDCNIVRVWEPKGLAACSAFVMVDLIWIREGVLPSTNMMKKIELTKPKPLVPISIGLQSSVEKSDFKLSPEMVSAIKELESRCRLAIRGAYTAEILYKHGVREMDIIGCPSLYQLPLFQESLSFLDNQEAAPSNVCGNFRSFAGKLTEAERLVVRHMKDHCGGFIEQTLLPISNSGVSNEALLDWFDRNSHVFFDLESWVRHNTRYDFSYGLRFHGNVAALLSGMKALFVTIDSRTREMTDFFELPAISMADIKDETTIVELYEKADYSKFIAGYQNKLDAFRSFLVKNELTLSKRYQEAIASSAWSVDNSPRAAVG